MRNKYSKIITSFFVLLFVACGAVAQAACDFEWAQDYAHSGDRSLKVYNDEGGSACSWVTGEEFSVTAGEEYDVSGWIKTENVADEAVIDVAFYNSGGGFVALESTDGVNGTTSNPRANDFVRRVERITVPAGSLSAKIGLALVGSGTVWFDDVYFSKVVSTSNVVSIVPTAQVVSGGDSVFVDVNITDTQGLYGFQFNITYNSTVLEYINLVRGSFIGSSDDTYWVGLDINTPGLIRNVAVTRTTPGEAVSGTGTLVSLEFRALSGGTSGVGIGDLKLAASDASEISSSVQNGEVLVGGGGITVVLTPTSPLTPTATPTPTPPSTPTSTPLTVPTTLPASCQYDWAEDYAHSGSHSLKIYSDDPGSSCSWVNENAISVVESQAYDLSGWIKTENAIGEVFIEVVFRNEAAEVVHREVTSSLTGTTSDSGENDFVCRTVGVIVPPNVAAAELRLVLEGTGTAWFDDLSFVQISTDPNTVRVSPNSQEVGEEESVNVDIGIVETQGLYGFQFDIVYDPGVLEYTDLARGTFIGSVGDTYWISEDSSTPGIIENIAVTRTTPEVAISGSGILVSLEFNALAEGTSSIRIQNLKLADILAQEIESVSIDGAVVVSAGEQIGPSVDIKAEGLDGSVTIPRNSSATLTWTSQRADSCIATGDWSGAKPVSGTEETGNLISNKTYALSCSGTGGTVEDEVEVEMGDINLNGDLKVAVDSSNWQDSLRGAAPLNDIDLKGSIAQCTINYTFWCDCADTGTSVPSVTQTCGSPDYKEDGTHQNPMIVNDICNYSTPGEYSAKVIIEKYNVEPVEDRATVLVVSGASPTSVLTPTPVPNGEKFDINGDGVVNVDDLVDLLKCWGKTYCSLPKADIDGNGEINARDALALVMYLLLDG